MTPTRMERDERTTAVENSGYRFSYLVLSFGLLMIVAFRSFSRGEQPWDLVALVVLSGVVHAAYQVMHRVIHRRWVILAAAGMIAGALLAALIGLLRH